MKRDRRLAYWGGGLLLVIAALALGAETLAPADPIEITDAVAGRLLPPGSRRAELQLTDGRTLFAERATATASGYEIERQGKTTLLATADVAAVRDRFFLLGSDQFGRDLASRLLFGARVSLRIGLLAGFLTLVLGIAVGSLAATLGGVVDSLLMRFTDTLLAFPHLFVVIALAAVFQVNSVWIAVILGLTGWMGTARLIRAEMLTLRGSDFVLAANAVGQPPLRILARHLLPNALTPVIAYTALRIGDLILVEASLSFLGLGVAPPTPTWGNMIDQGSQILTSGWWVATFPGVAIALTVIGFHLLGDGLRAWLDPRT